MIYADLLREHIEKSGMNLQEIADACKDRSLAIHVTYISKLRNQTRPAPTDEKISVTLAEVLNADPGPLLLAAVVERSDPRLLRRIVEILDPKNATQTAEFDIEALERQAFELLSKEWVAGATVDLVKLLETTAIWRPVFDLAVKMGVPSNVVMAFIRAYAEATQEALKKEE